MPLLQRKDAYSISIDPVDHRHRELIDLTNRLHDALDAAAARSAPASVAALLESVSSHLALEEKIVQNQGYGELASHQVDHAHRIDDVCDLIIMHACARPEDAERRELAERLDAWLCNHLRTHDGRFQARPPHEASHARGSRPMRLSCPSSRNQA